MVQREIGWRDKFNVPGSMTPLTEEAQLADSIAATKGPSGECSSIIPLDWEASRGGEVGVGFELRAWLLLGEGCSSKHFPLLSPHSESLSAVMHVSGVIERHSSVHHVGDGYNGANLETL